MADRFPLVVDSTNSNIKELPSGDNLDLTGSGIKVGGALTLGGVTVTATGTELNLLASAGTLKQAGKETIYVPATAMYPNTTDGCAALAQVELDNGPELKCLDFDGGATEECAQFTVAFPKSWNEDTVTFQVFWCSSAAGTEGVSWGLQGRSFPNDAPLATAFGTAIVVDSTKTAANDLLVSPESTAVTIPAAAVDTLTIFQIFRDTDDSNDTDTSNDARLLGIKLFFTTDAANDA
ncbi:uncharacterized protein METZ01_LOCUS344812 [marine metagenome]|uniref:IPT/TIG domain-containing protein n=1 Tax=marine metagenome TaxID=408172 RepID=A0A382R4H5_9ZZZZ